MGEKPQWINDPPHEINGFFAGIGFSDRFVSHSDTVTASYEDALVDIIETIGSRLSGELSNYENIASTFGYDFADNIRSVSEGELRHFYVIETWTDPEDLSVWTLAVAEK